MEAKLDVKALCFLHITIGKVVEAANITILDHIEQSIWWAALSSGFTLLSSCLLKYWEDASVLWAQQHVEDIHQSWHL